MLEYRIHRERTGVDRFAKEPPKIVKLAHDLESKGVEVNFYIDINVIIFFQLLNRKICYIKNLGIC